MGMVKKRRHEIAKIRAVASWKAVGGVLRALSTQDRGRISTMVTTMYGGSRTSGQMVGARPRHSTSSWAGETSGRRMKWKWKSIITNQLAVLAPLGQDDAMPQSQTLALKSVR